MAMLQSVQVARAWGRTRAAIYLCKCGHFDDPVHKKRDLLEPWARVSRYRSCI